MSALSIVPCCQPHSHWRSVRWHNWFVSRRERLHGLDRDRDLSGEGRSRFLPSGSSTLSFWRFHWAPALPDPPFERKPGAVGAISGEFFPHLNLQWAKNKTHRTCAPKPRRGGGRGGRDCLHHSRRLGLLRHAAVQKSSVGIEIDTIHDRIRIPTLLLRHNFALNL